MVGRLRDRRGASARQPRAARRARAPPRRQRAEGGTGRRHQRPRNATLSAGSRPRRSSRSDEPFAVGAPERRPERREPLRAARGMLPRPGTVIISAPISLGPGARIFRGGCTRPPGGSRAETVEHEHESRQPPPPPTVRPRWRYRRSPARPTATVLVLGGGVRELRVPPRNRGRSPRGQPTDSCLHRLQRHRPDRHDVQPGPGRPPGGRGCHCARWAGWDVIHFVRDTVVSRSLTGGQLLPSTTSMSPSQRCAHTTPSGEAPAEPERRRREGRAGRRFVRPSPLHNEVRLLRPLTERLRSGGPAVPALRGHGHGRGHCARTLRRPFGVPLLPLPEVPAERSALNCWSSATSSTRSAATEPVERPGTGWSR